MGELEFVRDLKPGTYVHAYGHYCIVDEYHKLYCLSRDVYLCNPKVKEVVGRPVQCLRMQFSETKTALLKEVPVGALVRHSGACYLKSATGCLKLGCGTWDDFDEALQVEYHTDVKNEYGDLTRGL